MYKKNLEDNYMIPLVKTFLPPADVLIPEIEKVLYSGYIAQGEVVNEFEEKFEKYIGNGNSVSLNSGTAALHIALACIGVGEKDEVISTALTAEPTNVAIKMTGAKIRYADIDYNTGAIDAASIEKHINFHTKAIIVVDYAGIPVNVVSIKNISQKYKIPVIQDAAHSLGSKFGGKMTGNHFPYTVFSLQAIKHMTTVDGGILHVHSSEDYQKSKLIRWFGLDKGLQRLENNIQIQGYKYHMNNVNAAIGICQFKYVDSIIKLYIENGKFYDIELSDIPGIELLQYYPDSEPSYWLYTLKVEDRDGFIRKMKENGISASELHKRSDSHDFLNDFNQDLPVLDKFYQKMVHIPCGWWVTVEDREKIANIIKSGW
jgi:perosamine synthetase